MGDADTVAFRDMIFPQAMWIQNANVSHQVIPTQQGPEKEAKILPYQKWCEGIKNPLQNKEETLQSCMAIVTGPSISTLYIIYPAQGEPLEHNWLAIREVWKSWVIPHELNPQYEFILDYIRYFLQRQC